MPLLFIALLRRKFYFCFTALCPNCEHLRDPSPLTTPSCIALSPFRDIESVPGLAPGSYVAPSAPAHGDLEDPPLVEAWVVPASDQQQQQSAATSSKQYPSAVGAYAIAQPEPGLVVMPPPGAPSGVVSLPQKSPGLDRRVNPRPEDAVYGVTFTRKPMQIEACPKCFHENGRTRIRTYPSLLTWISAIVLLLLFWPLAWLPLVWDKMKTTEHMCVKCNSIIGTVEPFSDCCEKRRK